MPKLNPVVFVSFLVLSCLTTRGCGQLVMGKNQVPPPFLQWNIFRNAYIVYSRQQEPIIDSCSSILTNHDPTVVPSCNLNV